MGMDDYELTRESKTLRNEYKSNRVVIRPYYMRFEPAFPEPSTKLGEKLR